MKRFFSVLTVIIIVINISSPIIFAVNESINTTITENEDEKNKQNTTNSIENKTIESTNDEKNNEESIIIGNDIDTEELNDDAQPFSNETENLIQKAQARMCVDEPFGNYIDGKIINIVGWFLCSDTSAKLKIYIDGKDTNTNILRVEREDVLKAVPGYGGRVSNPKPGFTATLDLSKVTYGNHTIKYVVLDGNGIELQKVEKTVTIDNRTKARMCVDEPSGNYIDGKIANVAGWFLCSDTSAKLKIYIDGKDTNTDISRVEREDVLRAVPGYGGRVSNPKPGFTATLDLSKVTYGNHTIKYVVLDGNGIELQKVEKTVTIDNRTKARMCVDEPSGNYIEGNTLNINGWYLCNVKSNIKLYIDNEEQKIYIPREEREDVLRAVSGYGGREYNPMPGYKITLDISKYTKGTTHKIKISIVDENNNEITTSEKQIQFFSNDIGELCLDLPTRTVFTGDNITFIGWEMSQLPDSNIKLYVDGKETKVTTKRLLREDVIAARSWRYGGKDVNPNPGYEITLNINQYNEGSHTVEIKLYSKEGKLLATKSKLISVVKNIYFGIDVSKWQYGIDWRAVKQEGVNYSIIRVGYGQTLSNKDAYFEANYNSCVQNGIPVGVYTYSYALNVEEARLEAYAVLNWLNGRNLRLPVFWDVEDKCQNNIDRDTLTAMADTFCSIIQNNGYKAGIYGNKNWLTNKLNMGYLQQKYDVWVAQYYHECTYEGRYDIWQYTSEGYLSGISGKVDCNWFYKRY